MKRQQAFCGNEKMLKGGLHGHTTRSDGKHTPEEVIRYHYQKGYDFLAITDHRIYNFKNWCPDIPITIIPGMEFDNTIEKNKGFRCFHTVCIGPEKHNGNGFEQDEYWESGEADNQEKYQQFLDAFHAKRNLTILCHPVWSSTSARYFENQKGNFAMEIWNSTCAIEYNTDTDAAYWDELLGQGKVIYGIAADDGHNFSQYCHGWVMVRAENRVEAILNALKNGAFYSTCGPEIYDFYVKDDKAVIECSAVSKIRLHSDMHPPKIVKSEDGTLTRAEFDLNYKNWGGYKYIRATIIDNNGKYAWTNPVFLEE